jgi:Pregnancy-associated plasma protein-A/Secretion system C-terminal sorting domain
MLTAKQKKTPLKKTVLPFFTVLCILCFGNVLNAQKKSSLQTNTIQRCGTSEWETMMMKHSPGFKQKYLEGEKQLAAAVNRFIQQQRINPNRTTATYTIPVVFHVVLSNQIFVTDAMIMNQFNVLNRDFAGTNADSTNIPAVWEPIRGHSTIQFVMAQRTPDDEATNGIHRITSAVKSPGPTDNDPIKSTLLGGTDAWDPTKYFNIWVGNFTNSTLLGYSSYPIGTPEHGGENISQQGIVVNASTLPGGSLAPYNRGRTLTHEAGHFFWLRHITGDSNCGDDFPQTPALDDTPLQGALTGGCPTGNQPTGCTSPDPPGKMYQNFMDYTDDACMSLFTNGQNKRAEQALLTFMSSLTTSDGGLPPVLVNNNAAIAAIANPINNFGTCDPAIPLTVTLRNAGLTALTSVTITVTRNASVVQTFNWTGNLASLTSVNVVLNPVPVVNGINTITVCTSLPNGAVDPVSKNDCKSVTGIGGTGLPAPLNEGFESTTFPPTGWFINNPDVGITWIRNTDGVSHSGTGKLKFNFWDYENALGQLDELRSPNVSTGGADSVYLEFWRAYAPVQGGADSLRIRVSTNCGNSFTTIYQKGPQELTTAVGDNFTPSAANQWVKESIDLSAYKNAATVTVSFQSINGYGNNLYLDDINLEKVIFQPIDLKVIAVNKPKNVCKSTDVPEVVVKNNGKDAITSFTVNWRVDNGTLASKTWTGSLPRNAIATVQLNSSNYGAIGNHTFTAYTTVPNGAADMVPANDTLKTNFAVKAILPMPLLVTEEFTGTTFPPAGWDLVNPDNDFTFERNATAGKKSPGSAYFNDFDNPTNNRFDDLLFPNYSYTGIDSIFLKFALSHVIFSYPLTPGVSIDSLAVIVSKDCGNTFTTLYKKFGEELQTVKDPNFPRSDPFFPSNANQWRIDSVNLGTFLGANEELFQVGFRFWGNFENNFFLDDISLRGQILPAKLKADGFLIQPSPFKSNFAVWHYQQPTTLKHINVFNMSGQRVWSRQFTNGRADKYITIDLGSRPAGIYIVQMEYTDAARNVQRTIMKY